MNWTDLLLYSVLILVPLCIFAYVVIKDRRYLKKSIKDVLSPDIAAELQKEQEEAIRRKNKFEALLKSK